MFYRFAAYGFLKNLRFFDPFIILIFREGGLSYLQIGFLYSIRDLTANVMEIPTGILADTFGRRRSMIVAFVAYIVSFVVFYTARGFSAYAAAMACFALGEAFRSGTHKALILEYLNQKNMQDRKVEYYGRTRGASQLGSAVNSIIAAALVFQTGHYRYMFIAAVVPYALNLINLMTYPRWLDGGREGLAKGSLWARTKATTLNLVSMLKDRSAMRAILSSASYSAVFKATKDYLQPILKSFAVALPILVAMRETERTAIVIGAVYFVLYLLTSAASRNAAWANNRFTSPARAINITFAIGAVLLVVVGVTSALEFALLSIVLFVSWYGLFNLRKPMNVAFISDRVSDDVIASGLSVESQLTTLIAVVLSPILGALADHFGVGVALAVVGGAMLLMSPLVRVKDA